MFRGPTIIALRARRMAYRIAAELLYPELSAPTPPDRSIRVRYPPPRSQEQIHELIEEATRKCRERERRQRLIRLFLALIVWALILMVASMAHLLPK
jgi:hypothetical protein